jgi:hypothetical protein
MYPVVSPVQGAPCPAQEQQEESEAGPGLHSLVSEPGDFVDTASCFACGTNDVGFEWTCTADGGWQQIETPDYSCTQL